MSAIDAHKSDIVPGFVTGALSSSTTYYFPVNSGGALVESVQLIWDAAIVITAAQIEDTNTVIPSMTAAGVAGEWIPENPTSGAYVATEGAGVTVTNATVAVAGGALGGAIWHLGNIGSRRCRLRLDIGGTGGRVQVFVHAKE